MTAIEVLFGLLGLVVVGSALLVVTTTKLVHAALWLVVTLGALAGCYLLLAAEFVAWVQVLIYVGAVVVLLLFALMLTRAPTGAEAAATTGNRPLAAVVAALVAGALVATLVAGFTGVRIDLDHTLVGSAGSTGTAIFTSWVLPFEVLSVLLLAALIGAIVLSRSSSPTLARGGPTPIGPSQGHPVPNAERSGDDQ
ncbi:MAG TPA: NADH-quinone oxidoreductase subunit J [Nocardioidaceae bacterium]|nr:NADH-quinone oxidoreductase subunit J [Nocardioidaceae bacterium]